MQFRTLDYPQTAKQEERKDLGAFARLYTPAGHAAG
jgi:hypothetical protein